MIFLHGGGDNPVNRQETFGRFTQAATINSICNIALVVAEESEDLAHKSFEEYKDIFTSLPISPTKIHPILVSPNHPLTRNVLESIQPSGVFVCGGVTPTYHQSLCLDISWVNYLQERRICYGGTSAGAAVAANKAILGGWQATRNAETRAILFQGASEGLGLITIHNGLGLVPFSIDVHASQMGTLTRLIHAVELGLVTEGWAIDENTILEVENDKMTVYGEGHVYQVWKKDDQPVNIKVQIAPECIIR